MKSIKLLITLAIAISCKFIYAEELIIFKAGQVAKAADINANFQALSHANTTKKYNILSNGNAIGKVHYRIESPRQLFTTEINNRIVDNIYIGRDGHIRNYNQIYFKSADCTGQAYERIAENDPDVYLFPDSKLRLASYSGNLYYIDGYTQAFKFGSLSRLSIYNRTQNCTTNSAGHTLGHYIPWVANEPSITGISTYPLPLPITVESHTEIQVISE
jgi:hypothetical protein